MRNRERVFDHLLGHFALLLIGVLGWAADRLNAGPARASQVTVHKHVPSTPGRAHA